MTPEQITALQQRVGNGLQWLSDHDPAGNFYAWWQVGLTKASRMPSQPPEVVAAWASWYDAKVVYDRLEKQLAGLERRGLAPLPWAMPWVPQREVRM